MDPLTKRLSLILIVVVVLSTILFKAGDFIYNAGYDKKTSEVAEANAKMQAERDKYRNELHQFKIVAKETIELKIKDAETAYLAGVEYGKTQVDLVTGDLDGHGLSVNVTDDTPTGGKCESNSASGATVNPETKRAKLSEKDARFFVALANEADDAVRQLTACQTSLREVLDYYRDRKVCR